MSKLIKLWLSISEANRKRIVSFLNTFIVTFLMLLAAKIELGFPQSWPALGALFLAIARSAVREAIESFVVTYGTNLKGKKK